jgi:zinc and cadmium transporter
MLALIAASCGVSSCVSALVCAAAGKRFNSAFALPLSLVAAGFLTALAFGHILPEAFEGGDPHVLGALMLAGVLALYCIESLIGSFGHEHGAMSEGGTGILAGTFLHTVCDGVVIALSYMSDIHVGIAMTVAVLSHEVAHEIGDYAVLVSLGMSRSRAYCVNAAAFCGSVLGGLLAYFVISGFEHLLPYALALSGASFIYVALSDLLPRFRAHNTLKANLAKIALIVLGAGLCLLIASHE